MLLEFRDQDKEVSLLFVMVYEFLLQHHNIPQISVASKTFFLAHIAWQLTVSGDSEEVG